MKKVLQIVCYFYPHVGGIEQVAHDIMQSLKGEDIEQKIICFNEDAEIGGYVCHRNQTVNEVVDGVEVIRCGCFAKVASQSLSNTYGRQLKKIMNEFQPDIVIFHYPNPYLAHYLLKYKKRKFKLVLYWHLDITKQKILGKLFKGQNKRLIKRADKVIGATPKHVNESCFSYLFNENKKAVLPYMIDEESLKLTNEEKIQSNALKNKYQAKILCFFIGRHVPYKGLRYLIEASSFLDDRFHFIIAGNGVLTEELKEMAANDSKIEFVGKISSSQKREYLFACDIFCFPSITKNEAFGIALAEAMYFSKPAVTFTIEGSGVNYVSLNGVTGIECPNRDSKAYADALIKLGEDEKLRKEYGLNARNRVLEHFTPKQFKENICKLISDLD